MRIKLKEHQILFRTEMVRAILDGRKTMTRRVVKPQPARSPYWTQYENSGAFYPATLDAEPSVLKCPYGPVGDRLWVRETFGFDPWHYLEGHDSILYRADQKIDSDYPIKWKSPYHMFKKYARIWLEITGIRVERLQGISLEDIKAEGMKYNVDPEYNIDPWHVFADLWDSINGKPKPKKNGGIITHYESYPWSEESRDKRTEMNGKPHHCYPNPWVWIIGFKRLTPNDSKAPACDIVG